MKQCLYEMFSIHERHWTTSGPEEWQTWNNYWTGQNITDPQYIDLNTRQKSKEFYWTQGPLIVWFTLDNINFLAARL